ncbi:hypothetical protein CLD22_13460 [Rubrivivax gelatinosus]|nr:hypothetical protein [Rubrivivax gelatinosus]
MPSLIDLLQWPAMLLTVAAAWFVGSTRAERRRAGFWLFSAGNLLWVAWGVHADAWALVLLQFCLGALNLRGLRKSADDAAAARDQSKR